ncbi:MAG: hypothetical protein FJ088_02755 [Deltaproteobacteria bacterium]|nr:hypothetical protein [Deltaproteobacteria bacterium]
MSIFYVKVRNDIYSFLLLLFVSQIVACGGGETASEINIDYDIVGPDLCKDCLEIQSPDMEISDVEAGERDLEDAEEAPQECGPKACGGNCGECPGAGVCLSGKCECPFWEAVLGDKGKDAAFAVVEITGKAVVAAGRTQPDGKEDADMRLVKIGLFGDIIWDRTYGGPQADVIFGLASAGDGGFAAAGVLDGVENVGEFLSGSFTVIKFDKGGSLSWYKNYGGISGVARVIKPVSSGGFVVAGWIINDGEKWEKMKIARIDDSGGVIWDAVAGEECFLCYNRAYDVIETTGGGFAIAGFTTSKGAGHQDMRMITLDGAGNLKTDTAYGGAKGNEWARAVQETAGGGFLIAGFSSSFTNGSADAWVVRTDDAGLQQWSQNYGGEGWDQLNAIVGKPGGFILAGAYSSLSGGYDLWLRMIDDSGEIIWEKTIGDANWEGAEYMAPASDGNLAIVGFTMSKGSGGMDFWVIRADETGNIPKCE